LATGTVVTAAIVLAIVLWSTGSSAATGYGTAEATSAAVRETLAVSGTVSPVHQAVAEFQTSGTVSAVNVAVGQTVTPGEVVATLDPTTLAQDVASAKLAVASAEAKLSEDESDESTGSSTSSTDTGNQSSIQTTAVVTTTGPSTTTVGATSSGGSTALQQAQQAVVSAQQTADADVAKASAAFSQAQAACTTTASTTSTTSTTTSTTNPSPTSTTTPPSTTSPTTSTSTTAQTAACTTALSASLAVQQQVTTDQKAVDSAETALAQSLNSSASTSGGTSGTTASGGSSSTGNSSVSTGTGVGSSTSSAATGGSGSTSTSSDSPEQLASDQASVDTAKATLITSQESLADAQLTAPLAGTVAGDGLAVGDTVSAGSSSDEITIINTGSYQATASLDSTQAPEAKVGDKALVSVDGKYGELTGTVARVGPVDTSSSSDTYPLVVALPAGTRLSAGSTAQIEVVLHQTDAAVAVPTSAVHTSGTTRSYVFVLDGGKEVRTDVTVGVVGGVYTQIDSGIDKGQTVVLADFSTPVPTSSSSSITSGRSSGFPGGSGGGGFAGGGFGA
jgi:multidrug efflux pump subunit AcrA (membrane-fusion protein)